MRIYTLARWVGGKTEQRAVTQRARPRRAGWTVVDSWPESDPPPVADDAQGWDAWRDRHGGACHH